MVMPATKPDPHDLNELIKDFWDGRISEARFADCAIESGMTRVELNLILQEIRSDDEIDL
jgi:hypothetical protein